jgi:hypothetical protein
MNFRDKFAEATAQLRARSEAIAQSALEKAGVRPDLIARRVGGFKKSLAVLNVAGRELNQVARRHASRFVKQNSPLFTAVRNDVTQIARSAYSTLSKGQAPKKARKPTASRKPAASRKRAAKAA